jgi:hypothetical protein
MSGAWPSVAWVFASGWHCRRWGGTVSGNMLASQGLDLALPGEIRRSGGLQPVRPTGRDRRQALGGVELVLELLAERGVPTTEKERNPRPGLPLVRAVVARLLQVASERLLEDLVDLAVPLSRTGSSPSADAPHARNKSSSCEPESKSTRLQEKSLWLCIYNTFKVLLRRSNPRGTTPKREGQAHEA